MYEQGEICSVTSKCEADMMRDDCQDNVKSSTLELKALRRSKLVTRPSMHLGWPDEIMAVDVL
jgi:hypothetical protein